MAISMIFAFLALTLMANQVAAVLPLSIFSFGLSASIGKPIFPTHTGRASHAHGHLPRHHRHQRSHPGPV